MNKSSKFLKELSFIKDKRLRSSAEVLINEVPDYFFVVAASSTGKYHPLFALGEGGLVRHTKVAVRIAKSLFDDPVFGCKYTSSEQDLIIISLILHDCIKHGFKEEKYTRADHPLLASKFISDNKEKTEFTTDEVDFMKSVIESHMGPWNTDYKTGEEILPKPHTKYESFVHMCDYLASRKFIDVKFVNDEIEE